MANENKEETFYLMCFYLGGDCDTDFSELNIVSLRSKTIEGLAKKLNLVKDFKKNVFNINLYESIGNHLLTLGDESILTIEQLEDWFKERGIEL